MSASTATSERVSFTSDTPVRVLHVCTIGLSARMFLLPVLLRLQADGYDVCFACRDDDDARFVQGHGLPFFPVYISRRISFVDLFAIVRLFRFIRRRRFHVVHSHTSKAGFVARAAAWLAGVPLVLCTQHGFAVHSYQAAPLRVLYAMLERWVGRRTHQFIAVTDRVRQYLVELGIAKPENICRIYNGIDFTRFSRANVSPEARATTRASWGCGTDTVVIGTAARLVPDKGLDDLVEAFALVHARHPDAILIIAGSGELMEPLRAQARRMGVFEAVRFIGWQQDVQRITACFDIFCLPTLREGFGYVFLEAQAMGVPVVATRIEPLTETMADGETAVLVPVKSPGALADALSALVAEPGRRTTLAAKAYDHVHCTFDLRTQLDQTMEFYRRVVGSASTKSEARNTKQAEQ